MKIANKMMKIKIMDHKEIKNLKQIEKKVNKLAKLAKTPLINHKIVRVKMNMDNIYKVNLPHLNQYYLSLVVPKIDNVYCNFTHK